MRRRMAGNWGVAGLVVGLLLAGRAAVAAEPAKGEQRARGDGFREEIRDEIREYVDDQRSENQEFRKTLEGLAPAQRCAAIKKQRETQHAENVAFAGQEYRKVVERMKQRMTERGVPAERQAIILSAMAERHAKRSALAEKQFRERMALLETLSGQPDLTAEQMLTQIKALHEKQKAEREALHAALRPREIPGQPGGNPHHKLTPPPAPPSDQE
jgi:hypothetical protein